MTVDDQPARILLVEDEPHIAEGLLFNLELEGYQAIHARTGEEALDQLQLEDVDLVVLDLSLPGIDGLEVCRRLREFDPRLPVLMLTARAQEQDRIVGLQSGADDYLTKPFSLSEFLLRIGGMLRRSHWYRDRNRDRSYHFGRVMIDLDDQKAVTPQGELKLTGQEIKLLRVFFANEGRVLSRKQLLGDAWGMSPDTETRTLDNFIVRLRRYFETDPAKPRHFETVRGRGYRFIRQPR